MAKRMSCVLGIDLGTSALKIVAVSCEGKVIATAREAYPTVSTAEGQAEQDPEHWLVALSVATKKITSRLGNKCTVESVALTGQMPTLVVLGKDKIDRYRPLVRAVTWQDSRADEWASQRVDDRFRREIYLKTGVLIDGRYLAPMFQFHRGSNLAKASFILSAKDFLFYALTGRAITDPSTASGYGLYNLREKAWDRELCRFWEIPVEQLPRIESSSFQAPLNERGSRLLRTKRAIPVVLGCADSVAGAHALNRGNADPRAATILTGSSTVILKYDAQPRWDQQNRFLVTPLALDDTYGREADLLASGSARAWARSLFGSNHKKSVWDRVYEVAPGADGLLFGPFLAGGEQGILWNPSLRGTISGLTLSHDDAHIARALLEGMCFEIRRCLQVFEEKAPLASVYLSGWMAESSQQSQLVADTLGRSVHAFKVSSASSVGAALLSTRVDAKNYSENIKSTIFAPSERKRVYNDIYAKYLVQFPAKVNSDISTTCS